MTSNSMSSLEAARLSLLKRRCYGISCRRQRHFQVVTTNCDRLAEYAANRVQIAVARLLRTGSLPWFFW